MFGRRIARQRRQQPSTLVAVATKWKVDFEVKNGSSVGWMMDSVSERMNDCWNDAVSSTFEACRPDAAQQEEEWKTIRSALDAYRDTGRVLPLRFKVGGPALHMNASDACQDLGTAEMQYRLPTLAEARMLVPVIAYGAVDWSGLGVKEHEIWVADASSDSDCRSVFRAAPGEEPSSDCLGKIDRRRAVCVPSSGPTPIRKAP